MYSNLKDLIPDSKDYENISESRDADFKILEKALVNVEKFIKTKSRILYGGMSIDFALKAAGKPGIYSDSTIPDYDFMSPNMYKDSIELADIMHKDEFPNVSSINAMHVTSRRVRINYVPVADITYIPQSLYDKVPTLKYNGLRVVHPDFQRIDMHRALSYPFEGAPMEVIQFRTRKDIQRFKLLNDAYPITLSRCKKFTAKPIEVKWEMFENAVIGDTAAYAFMRSALVNVSTTLKLNTPTLKDTFDPELEITPKHIRFKSLENRCCIITELLENKKLPNAKFFNRLLDDYIPKRAEVKQGDTIYEYHDSKGKLLPACQLIEMVSNINKTAPHWGKSIPSKSIWISGIQNVLLHFLARYWMNDDDKWLWMYWSGCELVKIAEIVAQKLSDDSLIQTPFFLMTQTYGSYNWTYTYIVTSRRLQTQIYDGRDAVRSMASIQPPFGYYPEKNEPAVEWSPNSWIFEMDGDVRQDHEPMYLIPVTSMERSSVKHGSDEFQGMITSVIQSFKSLSDPKTASKMFMDIIKNEHEPFEKLSQIKHQIQYVDDFPAVRLGTHWGQRKLILSEIQFLSKHSEKYVLYVGAAPGNKNHYLMTLFPEKKFIFVDPVKFQFQLSKNTHRDAPHDDLVHLSATGPTRSNYYNFTTENLEAWSLDTNNDLEKIPGDDILAYIKNSKFKGFLIEDMFTNSLAKKFAELDDCLFISDIRSFFTLRDGKMHVKHTQSSRNPQGNNISTITDITILWDMCLQFIWIQIMKPVQSMFKFRTVYYAPESLSHLELYKKNHPDTEYMRPAFEEAKKLGIDFISDYEKKRILYPSGVEYIQAFAPNKSGETRLYIPRESISKIVEYDHHHHDNTFFYHSILWRPFAFCKNPAASASLGFDHCQDCALETTIWSEYLTKHEIDDTPENIQKKVRETSQILRGTLDRRGHGKFFMPISKLMV